jgi:ubiquinone/menaquinone biosynthesis C-methylase UbiE
MSKLEGRLKKAFELIPECEKLLDIGCDRGEFTNFCISKAKEVHGFDVNKEAIQEASKKYPEIKFHSGNDRLPFKDSYFDVVTATEVMEHVNDEKVFLKEISRILKPGGTLILTVPHAGPFRWLDPFNLKYQCPRLYRFVKGKKFDPKIYNITEWHRHYSFSQLKKLFSPNFEIKKTVTGGFLIMPLSWFFRDGIDDENKFVYVKKFLGFFENLEYEINFKKLGYTIFFSAKNTK